MAILAEIFAAFPGRFRFTSGCRTPAQNAAANGVANSFHLTTRGCQAADFVPINGRFGDQEAIGAIVARHGYEVLVHDRGSGMHYHIEPAPNGAWTPSSALPGDVRPDEGVRAPTMIMLGLGFMLFIVLLDD